MNVVCPSFSWLIVLFLVIECLFSFGGRGFAAIVELSWLAGTEFVAVLLIQKLENVRLGSKVQLLVSSRMAMLDPFASKLECDGIMVRWLTRVSPTFTGQAK